MFVNQNKKRFTENDKKKRTLWKYLILEVPSTCA